MNIDGDINKELSDFKFDKDIAKIFDSHVRKSVPMYDEFHSMIGDISSWFIEDNTNVYDIGTSTGEGLKQLVDIHKNKDIKFIGVDNSSEMIEEVTNRFKDYPQISFINGDINQEDIHINNASFITSILTMQFISPYKRKEILQKIYNGINEGGSFVIVEKVVGNNVNFDEIFIELYHDFKIKQGFSEKEIFAKSRAIRGIMKPYTIQQNISLLEEVGFNNIDIFFKWCNFVGIIAIK